MELGTIADWLAAAAAAGALIAAIGAGRTAAKLYGVEAKRESDADELRNRRDARSIHAWAAIWIDDSGRRKDGIVVSNGSESPAYEMLIHSTRPSGVEPVLRLTVVPPGEYFVARTEEKYHWEFPDLLAQVGGLIRPIMKKPEWSVTELHFKDVDQREWVRRGGRLDRSIAQTDEQ